MQIPGFLIALFELRAHIPNAHRFETDPEMPYGGPLLRAATTFLVTMAVLSVLLWLSVRLAIGLL